MEKPNCYKCKYREGLVGSAHSKCMHHDVGLITEDPACKIVGILASARGMSIPLPPNKLNIKGNPHGIKKGWFNWPLNFDPVWLDACDGFAKKADQD